MTDIVLYRLNRVPDRHYVKFMELIGMRLRQAEAARTLVTFWLSAPQPDIFTIPTGTEIASLRTETDEPIVFTTDAPLNIRVPVVSQIMTGVGGEERRVYHAYGANSVLRGSETFPAFASDTPAQNDAYYIGFDNDLSNHIVGIDLSVDRAEGAGIDPTRPPYV